MVLDPVFLWLARSAVALLFAAAAAHKLRQPETFAGLLSAYGLLPQALQRPCVRTLPWLEATTALLMLVEPRSGGCLALSLLFLYSAAIGINLVRGNEQIECGCGGGEPLTLHPALLARNSIFALLAVVGMGLSSHRVWGLLDSFTLVAGIAVGVALYGGFHTALANAQSFQRRNAAAA